MKKVIFSALALVAATSTSVAQTASQQNQQPQSQRTTTPMKGGFCVTNSYRGGDSIFNCDHIGSLTIKQIYEKGWRVVTFSQNQEFKRTVELIIEEQR